MREIEPTRDDLGWKRLTRSISAKLIGSLLAVMVVIFALLGYLNIRLHRQHLEAATLANAERVSDVIKRSTTYYMLRNDREGLYHAIQTMADEPGMIKVRILDQEGRISYSTDPAEVSHVLDKTAEACYGCHNQSQPLTRLNRPDRFRIYRNGGGHRVLGIITPIENQPSCSNAACHAHPASQQVLGVLDTNLSLAQADAQLAVSTTRMLSYTAGAMLIVVVLSWLFVWRVVGKPIKALKNGTEHLSQGRLGYQIEVRSHDEVGDLAHSFNGMSLQLRAANEEIVTWAKTLEDRVVQKTKELQRAHEHMLHVEKMASMGKMAAVVAHEVNNPLSGILTYAKLLRKWVGTGQAEHEKREEAMQCLDLIAAESRRCGELVKNLLTLSRTSPMNLQSTNLQEVIDRCLLLVRHQLEHVGIELQLKLAEDLPRVSCDPAQIEQVLLALIMNAIDAMPRGGNLWLETQLSHDGTGIEIRVRDDGAGIAPDVLPQIFEPFMTTKENGRGVGLGLAISRGIVERHNGRIEVESELGRGTAFTITLPNQATEASLPAVGDTTMKVR
ncbi:MAG TPA: ATP-binding protein [Candidatus Eremiobacteraceae bacterium]|nr:ATP-binding protein [Candidatus Eremiobacteraceae bacterium]